jgi:hypothetical protein
LKRRQKSKECSRCGSTKNIEKHHIKFKSKGGTNDPSNIDYLCAECHDFLHAEENLISAIESVWRSIEYWGRLKERTPRKLRRLNHLTSRIPLLEKRLKVLKKFNTIPNIKKSGYRSYWLDKSTHGEK